MKILDIPQSGKRGLYVSYRSPFGLCSRILVCPANTQTPARQRMRGSFGRFAKSWSRTLTQAQREAWNLAGPKVLSKKRLGQSGGLSGQQFYQGINSARSCIGKPPFLLPPDPVVFPPNVVGQLTITNGEDGVRLWVEVSGPVTEDIMVFGQAPCSQGRSKRRNVSYLGLVRAAAAGLVEITALYVARYGEPAPGQRVFIVTRQQINGWEDENRQTFADVPDRPKPSESAVPPRPEVQQAVATQPEPVQQAPSAGALTIIPLMHKGCTPRAQGTGTPPPPECAQGARQGSPGEEAPLGTAEARRAADAEAGLEPRSGPDGGE